MAPPSSKPVPGAAADLAGQAVSKVSSATTSAAVAAAAAAAAAAGSGGAVRARKDGGGGGTLGLILSQLITIDHARTVIFWLVVYRYTSKLYRHLRTYGLTTSLYQIYTIVSRRVLTLFLQIPAARRKVQSELDKAGAEIESKLVSRPAHISTNEKLPVYGKDVEWLRTELKKLQKMRAGSGGMVPSKEGLAAIKKSDASWVNGESSASGVLVDHDSAPEGEDAQDGEIVWKGGRLSGAVYHGGQEMSDLLADAIKLFMVSNPLHPDVFPGVRKMEAEVVSMILRLYNAPATGAGTTTSGGTESILMACKTAREWAKKTKGISEPEMVIPESAHAAFDKAGDYFGIKIHHIPVDRLTRKVQLSKVARAINKNTILIVGSAPNFPDGIIDDIPSLAALARRAKVCMHVDCCLGSLLVPFLERAGLPSEPFDFRVDGVTSISCDTHKYGFAPKGSSVIMYRTAELRQYQYYVQPDWAGGVYASPSIAGSRPGSLIAGTWAALMTMGEDGYTHSCRSIITCARRIESAIRDEIPQLQILGKPLVSVVAFSSASTNVNIYDVGDEMSKRGWHLNALATDPPGIHLACTRLTVPVVEEFLKDLKAAVAIARKKPAKAGTMAALYGLGSSSAVGPSIVRQVAVKFLDTLYKV